MFCFIFKIYASNFESLDVMKNSYDLQVIAPINFSMKDYTFTLLKTYWEDKKWKIAGITYRRTKEIASQERRYNHNQTPIIDANTEFYVLSLPGFYSNLPKNLENLEIYFLHKEEPISALSLNITAKLPETIYIKQNQNGYVIESIHQEGLLKNDDKRDSYSCIVLEPTTATESIINRVVASSKKDYTRPLKNLVDYYVGRDNRLYYTRMTKHSIQWLIPGLWSKKEKQPLQQQAAIENVKVQADDDIYPAYQYGIKDLTESVMVNMRDFLGEDDEHRLLFVNHLIPFAKRQIQEEIILKIDAPIYIQNLVARRPKLKKMSYKNGVCLFRIQDKCLFIKMNLPIFVVYYLLAHNPKINKIIWEVSCNDNLLEVFHDLQAYIAQFPGQHIHIKRLDNIKFAFS